MKSRREFLTTCLAATALATLPKVSEAAELRPRDYADVDVTGCPEDLDHFRERFGQDLINVSRELHNRVTKESVRFLHFADGRMRWLYTAQAGAFVPFEHKHPEEEIFNVITGTLSLCLDGEWIEVSAGEVGVVPPMTYHCAANNTDSVVEVLVDFDPMSEEFIKMGKAYWMLCDEGYVSKNGTPKMEKLLPVIRETESLAYPKGIPVWLLNLLV